MYMPMWKKRTNCCVENINDVFRKILLTNFTSEFRRNNQKKCVIYDKLF